MSDAQSQPPSRNNPLRALLTHPLRLAVIGVAAVSLLLVACEGTDAADGDAATPAPTTTATPTLDPAGGGIEPANPESPPEGVLNSGSGSVPLGLGTYCWSPPTGSGATAMCVDKIGIITATEDIAVQPGGELQVTGDLAWPPMTIQSAFLYQAPAEPVAAEDDFRAWQATEGETQLAHGEHSVTLPGDLEPGRYVLVINYTAGPDRGSDAMYGALLVLE